MAQEHHEEQILIVDDDGPICMILERWLSSEGYTCHLAYNGDDALEILGREPVALMLTDINMPAMTGIELLSLAKVRHRDLSVIMVTAVDDREVALSALAQGALGYIIKPFEKIEVLLHVTNALRLRRLEMEHRSFHRGLVEDFLARTRALKEAYARLEESHNLLLRQEKMASLGQLAAGIAHELNNPATFVSSNLRTLKSYFDRFCEFQDDLLRSVAVTAPDDGRLDALRRRYKIDFIREDGATLIDESLHGMEDIRHIINGVKGYARGEEEGRGAVDLVACLDSTIKVVWNELKYTATLVRELPDALPKVEATGQGLRQVFTNLLVNAGQAMVDHGTITIGAGVDGGAVVVTIADTGCGIAPEELAHIFEPFYTTKPPEQGTGLGLAIAREIVEQWGGSLTVASEVNKGTTFTLRLPVAAEQEEACG